MPGGYVGKLLRVDLTKGTVKEESLPNEDVLKKYVGCFGLGLRILYDEVPPSVKPADPENRLIFMTGPFNGLPVPSESLIFMIFSYSSMLSFLRAAKSGSGSILFLNLSNPSVGYAMFIDAAQPLP